jgi:F0F1-type ATP synthase gamma subunit
MEMISTARIQKALHAAEETEPYKEAITEMLANAASVGSTGDYPLLATHLREQNVLYILIASDRGLAGGFNIVPQREVEHDMRHLMSGEWEQPLLPVVANPQNTSPIARLDRFSRLRAFQLSRLWMRLTVLPRM